MTETWQERIERDLVEGKAVARGERRKADEEEAATPELCLAWSGPKGSRLDTACLQPKGHDGPHSWDRR